MIAYLEGDVLYSDGKECIIKTEEGIGYQIVFSKILVENTKVALFISQIFRENSQDLFGFLALRDKKIFETLLGVKGVGPKSAYALITFLEGDQLLDAIRFERKKVLMEAPGIGAKAASQIILDLSEKMKKFQSLMGNYSLKQIKRSKPVTSEEKFSEENQQFNFMSEESKPSQEDISSHEIISETLLACSELGFKENDVLPVIQNILNKHRIEKSEQLVHLVLKGI